MARHRPLTKRLARGLLLVAGATALADAAAQTRTFYSAAVPFEVEHDSNPNLLVGDSPGVTWLRVRPSWTAGYVLGTEVFSVEAALNAQKSSNPDVARDRVDPRLRGVWKHEDERNITQLAALLDRRAYRALDVIDFVPVGVDGSRTLFALSGSWLRHMDERTQLLADLRQDWERYSTPTPPDFRRTVASLRLTRQQTERRSIYAAVNAQHYRADAGQDAFRRPIAAKRSSVAGVVAGMTYALSEAWRFDANAGPVHFTHPESRNSWQGAVRADYTGERWSATGEVSRSPGVVATGAGLAAASDARLQVRYDVDPRTRLELDAAHRTMKASDSTRTLAGVAWVRQWSPSWQMSVRASTHRLQVPGGTARSHRIALVLTYLAADL